MAAEQDYGIEELTGFAMDIIHGVGEKALTFYGKGQHQTRFDEDLVTTAELRLSDFGGDRAGADGAGSAYLITTLVPTGTFLKNSAASCRRIRMQPWEAGWPGRLP